jgi:TonB dependent receptor
MNWVFSPNLLMEARYGIQRNQDTYNIGERPQQFDISGRLMRIVYPDPQAPNTPFIDPLIRNQLQIDRRNALQQIYNNVTLVRGDHTINAGGTFRWVHWYDADYRGGGVPQYNLGLGTGDPVASIFGPGTLPGIGQNDLNAAWTLYSILTGRVSGIEAQRGVDPESRRYLDQHQLVRNDKQRNGGLYLQDQWRLSPALTVNYGVRWQASGPVFNATDVYTNPTEQQLLGPSTALFSPGRLDGVQDPVIDLRPRTYRTDWNNVAPNAGVAWTPGEKLATASPGRRMAGESYGEDSA